MRAYSFGWFSHRAGKHMEFQHYGHAGAPVLVFPTSGGDHREFADRGMLDPLAWKIEQGLIQIFCLNSNSWEGWYNTAIPPRQRVEAQESYEQYLIHELLPHVRTVTGTQYLILTGISFGGYHAINFALRHPELVNRAVSLSGSFDIKSFLDGYYDELCYFHNPVDYVANLDDGWYIDMYNSHTELTLVTSEADTCLDRNRTLSQLLGARGIRHQLITWDGGYAHDWPAWKLMIPQYL